jgi:thiamine-monophosphate kinase
LRIFDAKEKLLVKALKAIFQRNTLELKAFRTVQNRSVATKDETSGEFELIEIIKGTLLPAQPHIDVGIGDDAAVIRSTGGKLLLCSDCLVEGVHFDLALTTPKDLGYKAVAAALSDIAAMNGIPIAVVISIALPKRASLNLEKFVRQFYEGTSRLRRDIDPIKFDIVGGDLSSSPSAIFIDVAATGESHHPILRSGAKGGDILAVSGFPGLSAAGLYGLQNWKTVKQISGALTKAHTCPVPRFDLSTRLDPKTCHALIDVSDGLASEAHHIAKASRVRFEIIEDKLPKHPAALALAELTQQSVKDWALFGGEDYELLATFAKGSKLPEGFIEIGRALPASDKEPTVTLVTSRGEREVVPARGFNHFA